MKNITRDPVFDSIGCFDKDGFEIYDGDVCEYYTRDSSGNITETKTGWVQPGWGDNTGPYGKHRKTAGQTLMDVCVIGAIGDGKTKY